MRIDSPTPHAGTAVPVVQSPTPPTPITIAEIKVLAQKKLPKQVWDYYITGADEEKTVARNEAIYDK